MFVKLEKFIDNKIIEIDKSKDVSENIFNKKINEFALSLLTKIKQIFTYFANENSLKQKYVVVENPQYVVVENPRLDLDDTSSIIYNPKTEEYVYLSEAPPIENLVISGGGAKGVILMGVLEAFEIKDEGEDLSFRDQLKNIAGSSIGAVTAALIAAGIPSDNLIKATDEIEFQNLLGKGIGPIHKSGQPLLDFMRSNLKDTLSGHLKEMFDGKNLDDIQIKNISQLVREKLKGQEHTDKEIINAVTQIYNLVKMLKQDDLDQVHITFAMLHTLHELDPKVFKDLTVTATCRENGETFYFNAERTPDLDIAVACRASASLPVVLVPVEIEREILSHYYRDKLPKEGTLTFVDGGYFENIPVAAMQDKQGVEKNNKGEQGQNLQTLALVFDETGRTENEQSPFLEVKIHKPLYHSKSLLNWLVRDIFARFLAGIATKKRNTTAKEEGLEEIRQKYTQRNIPLLVEIKTGDFKKSKKLAKEYRAKGFNQTIEYLDNHKRELIARHFKNFNDLLEYVPEEIQRNKKEDLLKFQENIRPPA